MFPRCCASTPRNPQPGAAEATHFRGGSYRLYENKRDKHPILTYVVDMDSPEAASTYLAMYRQVLQRQMEAPGFRHPNAGGAVRNRRRWKILDPFAGHQRTMYRGHALNARGVMP